MHILITDSGVGGLSVCAYAERFFRTHGFDEPIRLTYVNASPENDFGYNSMGSTQEKLEHFDRFLHIVTDRYAPDPDIRRLQHAFRAVTGYSILQE